MSWEDRIYNEYLLEELRDQGVETSAEAYINNNGFN